LFSISEYRAHYEQNGSNVNTAIAIGNFDAVHRGHLALVEAARSAVGEGGRVEMWSFDPPPVSVLQPEVLIERITTFSQRRELLIDAGADEVRPLTPTPELLALEPRAYIKRVIEEVAPSYIIEGEGFRFGHQRAGTIETLRSLGDEFSFDVIVIPRVDVSLEDNSIVRASSSMIRQLLNNGQMADVTRMLGREYVLSGIVVPGDHRGRQVGIPTANLGDVQTMLPRDGIYAGSAQIDGTKYIAAISIGTKPTFGINDRVSEVHLIGFDGVIGHYDWPLNVTISHWIREQIAFDSVEALTLAIEDDIQTTISLIESTS
jgi:riboflavin kinase/FMN adenylyltransferase